MTGASLATPRLRFGLSAAWLLLFALAVAGCGSATPISSGAPSATDTPAGSGDATPKPTSWPGTTASAVTALGASDTEIQKAATDLQQGVDSEDLPRMLGAAEGFAKLITEIQPNVDRLDRFDKLKPLAAAYRIAFPQLLKGSNDLRDALKSGNAAGIVTGVREINDGMKAYAAVRPLLADLVPQALEQQRLYTK
jgi:hypothetical protein